MATLEEFLSDHLEPGEQVEASCSGVQAKGALFRTGLAAGLGGSVGGAIGGAASGAVGGSGDALNLKNGAILVATDRRLLIIAQSAVRARPESLVAAFGRTGLAAERGSKRLVGIKIPTLTITPHEGEALTFEVPKAKAKGLDAVATALGA